MPACGFSLQQRRSRTRSITLNDRKPAKAVNVTAAWIRKRRLQFVHAHPARPLRIEDRVGFEIEIGKDADLVLWTAPPLSTLSRCGKQNLDRRTVFYFNVWTTIKNWRHVMLKLQHRFGANAPQTGRS